MCMLTESLTVVTEAPVSEEDQPLGVAGASRLQTVEHECAAESGPISNLIIVSARGLPGVRDRVPCRGLPSSSRGLTISGNADG